MIRKTVWKILDPDVVSLLEPAPLTPLGPYLRTRKLIKTGHPLWELSPETLKEKRLQSPWYFNLYESIFASVPAYIAGFFASFFPTIEKEHLYENFGTIFNTLYPILPPILLLALAYTAGWSSLRWKDFSMQKAKIARKAYLYLDGAYGLLPQSLIACFNTLFWASIFRESLSGLMVPVIIGNLLSWTLFLLTNWHTVRVKLFSINGYGKKSSGPRVKYIVSMAAFAIVIAGFMVVALCIFSFVVASLIDSSLSF